MSHEHVFRDGEGIEREHCVTCGAARDQATAKPPYPFCSHAEKCIAAGRCTRSVRGEPWSCAD